MKSFKQKNAMTILELVISITISVIIIWIVSVFVTHSINDLLSYRVLADSINKWFTFRDVMDRNIRAWNNIFTLYWTWNRNVILLENINADEWILYWIVDFWTKKIEQEYIYGDKFIWYRRLSEFELNNVKSNSWVIYDYNFFIDKIYKWMRIKDFHAELYNSWEILDLNMSIIMIEDESNFWKNFNDFFIPQESIFWYNLNF